MGGGCIGEVYKVELEDGTPLVAKVDRDGESHLEREAYMLRYLREKSDLPVPEVYHGSETLLLMEFVEGSSHFSEGAEHHAAELLAALHGITAEAYGHERDTLIGSLDQPNPWTESWAEFFREHRLLYIARVAHDAGRLPAEDLLQGASGCRSKLDELDRRPQPSRPHPRRRLERQRAGEGGSHNRLPRSRLYYADPEIELAFISLFDSFGERLYGTLPGRFGGIHGRFFEARRDLYNLYPLLVHVYLFRRRISRFGA